jgi:hypothetical protein
MRALLRSGPLLLALGVLTGCDQSNSAPSKRAEAPPAKAPTASESKPASAASAGALAANASKAEYVVTVKGMV